MPPPESKVVALALEIDVLMKSDLYHNEIEVHASNGSSVFECLRHRAGWLMPTRRTDLSALPGHRLKQVRGFSLVEIMVVLVIIGLLAGLVTVNVRGYLIRAKQDAARSELATIINAVETFYTEHDRYPTNDEGLRILAEPSPRLPEPLLDREPVDPWGRPYLYNQPGRDGPYEVLSMGADGREGGEAASADADLGSWNLHRHADEESP